MSMVQAVHARIAVGALALGLALTGCAASDDSSPAQNRGQKAADGVVGTGLINVQQSGTPTQGGVVVAAEYAEARSLDPTVTLPNGGSGGSALLALYDSLVTYDETTRTYEPALAESLVPNAERTQWTLTLRDGVRFSDGTAVDAAAVVASIERYVSKHGLGSVQWNLMGTTATEVDDRTVRFDTEKPWARLDNMLATGPGMIVAPAAYADPENFRPIGAGPFVFGSYRPGEALELKANPDHFAGRPHLDGLKFVWPTGDASRYEALANGDVDTALIKARVPVDSAVKAKYPAMRWTVGQGRAVFVNRREGRPAQMREVRDAMNLAFDPVALAMRTNEDPELATKSLFPVDSPWYSGVEPVAQDLTAAKAKVAEAKAKGFDGRLTLTLQADPASQQVALSVKGQLDAAGFTVAIKTVPSVADLIKAMYVDHDYDLAFSSVGLRDSDPAQRFVATAYSTAPENAWGYANDEMDRLLIDLSAADGPQEGAEVMKRIESVWQEDPPVLGMTSTTWLQPWNQKVHGITPAAEMMLRYDKAWKN